MELQRFFQKDSLCPVIIQHIETQEVLMLGYTNKQALQLTLETKTVWFWSRSRNQLWNKGETSGNMLEVKEIFYDCDEDTLLYLCMPKGPTCHTGERSCFYRMIDMEEK